MAFAAYLDAVQKIYIAFYQRPADPAGLRYWAQRMDAAGGDQAAVIDAFATSPEAVALYGPIDASTIGTVVDAIYLALYNRAPDADGKKFYVDGFNAGTFTAGTIALNVLNGASNDDSVAISNKLGVANEFTKQVDGRALTNPDFGTGTSFNATYSGDADSVAARDILKAVTASPATVLNASQVTDAIKTKIADATDPIIGQTSGQTFTLTQGVDTPVGTAGNDTFVAADHNKVNAAIDAREVFGVGDDIKGGTGVDTLQILGDGSLGSVQLAKIAEVEKVELTSDTAGQTATDLRNVVGVQEVTVKNGGGVAANLAARDIVAGIDGAMLAGSAGVTFTYAAANTANDSATLKLNNAVVTGTPAGAIAVTVQNTAGAAIENLTINNTGTSRINLNTGLQDNITVNAEGSLRIDGVAAVLDTFTATGSTGNVRANLVARNGELDAALGAGNDRIDVSNAAFTNTALSTFKGGAGTDTFVLNASFDNTGAAGVGTQRTALNQIEGFEVFGVSGANTADINLANTTISQFLFENTGNVTLTEIENGDSFTVNNDTNVAATMKTGQTALNLTLLSQATGTDVGTLTTTGVQTVNLASNAAAANQPANTIGFVNNGVANNFTVNVTGAQDLTIGGFAAVVNVNAAAATGDLNITGSNGADIIVGGSGDDIITGGQGADTLTGGAGEDQFVIAFGGNTVGFGAPVASQTVVTTTAFNNVSEISIDIGSTTYTVTGLGSAPSAAALAAAVQASLRAQLGDTDVTVTAVGAVNPNAIRITDAAGRDIDEASLVVLQDDATPGTPAAADGGASLVTVAPGSAEVIVTPSQTTIDFGTGANVIGTGNVSIDIDGVTVTASAGAAGTTFANINQIATALVAAAAALGTPITITAVPQSPTSLLITSPDGFDIDETTFTADDNAVVPAPIAAVALEVVGGNEAAPAVASTADLTVSDITDVSSITLTIGGVTQTVAIADNAHATDVAFAATLQGALQTAFGVTVTVADVGGDNGIVRITNTLGTGITASAADPAFEVLDEGVAPTPATPDAGAAAIEEAVGNPGGGILVPVGPSSNAAAIDTITDFTLGTDLLVLTEADGTAAALPTAALYAGDMTATATSLANALTLALSDANGSASGVPVLADGNAVFFMYQGNTYVFADNQNTAGFNAADPDNVMVKITGSLGLTEGALTVATIFG